MLYCWSECWEEGCQSGLESQAGHPHKHSLSRREKLWGFRLSGPVLVYVCRCTFFSGFYFILLFCGSSEELCDSRRAGQGAGRERNAPFWDFKEESVPIPVHMGLVHLICWRGFLQLFVRVLTIRQRWQNLVGSSLCCLLLGENIAVAVGSAAGCCHKMIRVAYFWKTCSSPLKQPLLQGVQDFYLDQTEIHFFFHSQREINERTR